MQDLHTLAHNLAPAVRRAASYMQAEAATFSMEKVEYKGLNDLVSHVDKTVEAMLVKECKALLPDSGFILEEADNESEDAAYRWIIDPLDGTTNFTHGLPCYCISIALQYQKETVLGVVFDVVHDEYFQAIRGSGATLNGKPIQVSAAPRLSQGLVATGFPYTRFDRLDDYLAVFKEFLQKTLGVRRFGSAALDLAWTACGRFDGYYEYNLQPWDVAAGALIVQEAGGTVTHFDGSDNFVFGKQLAASNALIQQEMLSIIQTSFTPNQK